MRGRASINTSDLRTAMTTFVAIGQQSFKYQIGFSTDIGGGRENQDEGFIWTKKETGIAVLGILDGHGREVGRLAALAAKSALVMFLEEQYERLLRDPAEFLVQAHELAHANIKSIFAAEFEKLGYQVKLNNEGYLLKRRSAFENWSCVHGGAACTIVALVQNSLYVSNVGDSTAIMCTPQPVLNAKTLKFVKDAAFAGARPVCNEAEGATKANVLVLTAEHSPESSYEFERLRRFRPRENDPSQPALFVVYDSASHDKSQCAAVFDTSTGHSVPGSSTASAGVPPCASQKGRYIHSAYTPAACLTMA
jgi:hypothetical protein